jgi:hypothetical protein
MHPACADRLLGRALFVALAALLLFSLAVGLRGLQQSADELLFPNRQSLPRL